MTTNVIQQSIILEQPPPLDKNPAAVYVLSLGTKAGQAGQASALRQIASIFHTDINHMNWAALRYEHTAAIRSQLAQTYKPAHANKLMTALKQTLKNAWRLGQISMEDYARATDLPRVKGESLPAGRALTQGEIYALFMACQNDRNQAAGIRDAALIALLYTTGVRREEAAGIQLDDYDIGNQVIRIEGKGSIEADAPIIEDTACVLTDWLEIRGSEPGPLFLWIRKDGAIMPEGIGPKAIWRMCIKRGQEAKIRDFTPHDLRRTFVTHMLDAGQDLGVVSKTARHKNINTTQRYNRQSDQLKRRAASTLHVPYTPRNERRPEQEKVRKTRRNLHKRNG